MATVSALDQLELDCRREAIAYECWLKMLTPLRRFCVVGSAVFSTAAGVAVFWDSLPHGKIISAALAFSATALTATHAALKCDEHQAECRRLIQAFKSIRMQIPECRELDTAREPSEKHKLITQMANLVASTHASPSDKCYRRADDFLAEAN